MQSSRERLRHLRQYAEGELSPEQSFYFPGSESKLNLRAQNLRSFLHLAEGVDDETWTYHLRKGDYSARFKSMIKDDVLARQAAKVQRDKRASPKDSREKIKEAVESRYTACVSCRCTRARKRNARALFNRDPACKFRKFS